MWKVDCRDGCNDLILLSSTNLEKNHENADVLSGRPAFKK